MNQYGNLPRNLVKRLTGNPNACVGKVQTKNGLADGVWQRTKQSRGKRAGLELMAKFEGAHDVRQHLDFRGIGQRVFAGERDEAVAKVIASTRRALIENVQAGLLETLAAPLQSFPEK